MAKSIAEIRAQLQAQDKKAQDAADGNFNAEPSAFLAHWNIEEGQPLNLRLLPDADESNDYFWKERDMINLSFKGIKGSDMGKTVKVSVPCNEMWDGMNSCPVLRKIREEGWFNEPALEDAARQYWKKKSFLFQCLIAPNSTEVKDDNAPENPIRRILLNKPLFTSVKSIMLDPDMEELPTDFDHGTDFRIMKGKNAGGYASYDESTWARKERPLNQEERDAIDKYGLFNLSEFMPAKPTAEQLVAIEEMFEASMNEEPYDPVRWAEFYRPAGVQKPTATGGNTTTNTESTTAKTEAAPVKTEAKTESAPAEKVEPKTEAAPAKAATAQNTSTADLLAKLKASKS